MSGILAKTESTAHYLLKPARWLMLLIVLILPWWIGGVLPTPLRLFIFWSHLCGGLALLAWLLRMRAPSLPLSLILICLTLCGLGWFSVFNARFIYDPGFYQFTPLTQTYPGWPGSHSLFTSQSFMWRLQALLILLLIMTDACRHRIWRDRCLKGLLVSGGLLMLFGFIQKILQAPAIYWLPWNTGNSFFGSFVYHGNAGAFLNLCWPLTWVMLLSKPSDPADFLWKKIACWLATLLALALWINLSRAAAGIGTLCMIITASLVLVSPYRHRLLHLTQWLKLLMGLALGSLALAALSGLLLPTQARWNRWSESEFAFDEGRSVVFQICENMIREQPWFGHGPGTFSTLFPFKSGALGSLVPGFWRYAHNDYLQTWVEWGGVGLALFSCLFLGACIRVLAKTFLRTESASAEDRLLCYGCCAALLTVLLHSTVDFPLQILSVQVWVIILLALCWSKNNPDKKTTQQKG
jgi:O-antigen ligase